MLKFGVMALIPVLLIQLVFSISIKDLVAKLSFSAATPEMNVTNYSDFMADNNNNSINDTLVFQFTTINSAGTFIFAVNLIDRNGILTNETSIILNAGTNKVNITFSSLLLSQEQFNYSIKVYNSSRKQKFRKDNILTQIYSNYEEGFRIIDAKDSKISRTLMVNLTIKSPENKTHITTLFLNYGNSTIFSKGSKAFSSGINNITFDFESETIKRTHNIGNFEIPSVKIGRKTYRTNFTTGFYDFRDFAAASFVFGFDDSKTDLDGNGKYGILELNANISALNASNYILTTALYDLFDALVEIKNISINLGVGINIVQIKFNGTSINEKKLNGPFIIKYAELYQDGILIDKVNDAYTTKSYNFNDIESPDLPDLTVNLSVSEGYHYGLPNITINFTFKNTGKKQAFNVIADMFDNRTFAKSNRSSILDIGSKTIYQIGFYNISDFEATAIADLQNLVEENDEGNNAQRIVIKLNQKPVLTPVGNITVNETDRILINISASDLNSDNLSYSVNLSKFSASFNVFEWNTSTTDSGNYSLAAIASDGFLNASSSFRIVVLDAPEKDIDNDGIQDSVDKLIGNENSVNTSTINLSILISSSRNLSKLFSGNQRMRFMEGNVSIADFDFDFSLHKINLRNMTINKQSANAKGSLIFKGMKMPEGSAKTLYVDRIDNSINGVCIKDEEISSLGQISNGCSANNEHKVECDGTLQDSYICNYNSTLNKYKIQGLRHSGIIQIDYAKPAPGSGSSPSAPGTGSSGGGGGSAACSPDWQCGEWAECAGGLKSRKCLDKNSCNLLAAKPAESESCQGERKIFDIIKPSEYIDESIKTFKINFQPKQASQITGRVTGSESDASQDIGIFIVFMEAALIVGGYLLIRKYHFKNL